MQIPDEVRLVHEAVDRELSKQGNPLPVPENMGLLKKITEFPPNIVNAAMGDTGKRLLAFATKVDFQHPDLFYIVDNLLTTGEFSRHGEELLQLAKLGWDNNLFLATSGLAGSMNVVGKNSTVCLKIRESIDDPAKNMQNVRFIADKSERENIRKQKKLQEIDLSSFCQKGNTTWQNQPSSFAEFVRNSQPFKQEIERAHRLIANYENMDCPMLGDKIKERIAVYEEQNKEKYYGFNRLTVTNAAVIGAKMHGCTLSLNTFSRTNRIVLPPELANSCKLASLGASGSKSPVEFLARYYPLNVFDSTVGERVKKTVDFLEAFPEASGKPIFDHFRVLFFGPNYIANVTPEYAESQEVRDLIAKLDNQLFRLGLMNPILMGEKEGKSYFIDYLSRS